MKIYNINEITDSRLQYDKNPPELMKYVILIVIFLIISGLIWANNSVKTYIVKGKGVVVTSDKSYIMSKVSGEITELFINEGDEVKVGDVLFTTNAYEIDLQLQQINSQIETYQKRITLLSQAEENATNGTNYFDKYDEFESEFYNRLSSSYIARKEYSVDVEALKKQGYEQEQIDEYAKTQNNKWTQHYYETIEKFTTEKKQHELEIANLQAQKKALEKGKEQYSLKACIDGIVHLNTELTPGMFIQNGSLVGTISNKEKDLLIEVMVASSDRPRIHVEDEVSIAISGLDQSEYGTIPGKVIHIDQDATIDNEKGDVYFKVKIKPEKTYLIDSKGEKVNLILGMVTEARVKYENITYMKYILELIGIKFN